MCVCVCVCVCALLINKNKMKMKNMLHCIFIILTTTAVLQVYLEQVCHGMNIYLQPHFGVNGFGFAEIDSRRNQITR